MEDSIKEEDIGQEAEDFVSRFKTCSNVRIHTFWEMFKWYWNDIGGMILLLIIIMACLVGIMEFALRKQEKNPIVYKKIDGHEYAVYRYGFRGGITHSPYCECNINSFDCLNNYTNVQNAVGREMKTKSLMEREQGIEE